MIPAAEWALRIVSIMDDTNLVRRAPYYGRNLLTDTCVYPGCRAGSYESGDDARSR